ncbi:MAG: hypothetical protein HYX51_02735 [Chloroflexi bacterium]|nr:hypothetical protein [Chloroflexota bacterium]
MVYTVYVDDNFQYMDESVRYKLGEFADYDAAVAACKRIVDEFLVVSCDDATTADSLYESYVAMGEDPFIVAETLRGFSAWTYARQRCDELCGVPIGGGTHEGESP